MDEVLASVGSTPGSQGGQTPVQKAPVVDLTAPARKSVAETLLALPAPSGAASASNTFSWKAFIKSFDPEVLDTHAEAVERFPTHEEVAYASTSTLAQTTFEDLLEVSEMPKHVRAKGLVRECVSRAKALHAPKPQEPESPSRADRAIVPLHLGMSEKVSTAEDEELVRLVGGKAASALTVARLLRGEHQLDVKLALRASKLNRLGFFHTAGDALFKVLHTVRSEWLLEKKEKKKVCFPYVDLTRGDVIAPWLSVEKIGGQSNYAGEGGLDALARTEDVERLGKALTSLSAKRRFFRSFDQWLVAFLRFATAAVTCLLVDWDVILLHIYTMTRLKDDERAWGEAHFGAQGSTFLMIYYDELHRQNIASRADRGDESLSLVRAFKKNRS